MACTARRLLGVCGRPVSAEWKRLRLGIESQIKADLINVAHEALAELFQLGIGFTGEKHRQETEHYNSRTDEAGLVSADQAASGTTYISSRFPLFDKNIDYFCTNKLIFCLYKHLIEGY